MTVRGRERRSGEAGSSAPSSGSAGYSPFARSIGYTRFVVLLAVASVMLIAFVLFILGTGLACVSVWHAGERVLKGEIAGSDLTVDFLEVVSIMLKAVVFYLIGIGMYSLFITPLNLTVTLGVETLNDLESKVVSVVIVIMAVTFLEHFISWEKPTETLQFGGALSLVVAALVLFQFHNHREKEDQHERASDERKLAEQELFQEDHEQRALQPDRSAS